MTLALLRALALLQASPSGSALLEAAGGAEALLNQISWGSVAKTEVEIERALDPKSGEERLHRTARIVLRARESDVALALDLAHELVHFARSGSFDPYDPSLTLARHIHHSIEGPGGEVDAIEAECRVASEIAPADVLAKRCPAKWVASRKRLIEALYRSGAGKAAPFGGAPVFLSAAGRAPYPVALAREYRDLQEQVCRNAKAREASLQGLPAARERERAFLRARCGAS